MARQKHPRGGERPHFARLLAGQNPSGLWGSLPATGHAICVSPVFLPRRRIWLAYLPALLPATLLALHHQSQTRRNEMPLIQAPVPQAKKVKVTHRLDESLLYKVRRYAEFIRAKNDYVITEALTYFFGQDAEFAEWLASHPALTSKVHKRDRTNGNSTSPDRVRATVHQNKPNGTAVALDAPGETASAGGTI
jgi:hypothetical protein